MNVTTSQPPATTAETTSLERKERLVRYAHQLGFDSCRIARCARPAHIDQFHDWLNDGAHGQMAYMARGEEKRRDPQRILPGAKSIIVFALNYFQGVEAGESPAHKRAACTAATTATSGRIARYAWGDDYHDVIASKLKKIDEFLHEFGGEQKCYVDTGPILERDHAAEAGLGWHGKSTMLIDEKLGTWFFLAEILTTLDLPQDAPVRNRCGTCERCITACPDGSPAGGLRAAIELPAA